MLEKFLEQTEFADYEDFMRSFKLRVPDNFNFAYDVVDAWAATEPDRRALTWTDAHGRRRTFTFAEMKAETDRTASFFASQGIGRGDRVMLILKRRYQFWLSIIALHKLGATAIPATHLLMPHDIVYRIERGRVKAVVAAGEPDIVARVQQAVDQTAVCVRCISTGPAVPEGWVDFDSGLEAAAPFVRPEKVNDNDDVMLIYFTSGTTGEPKMVAHDFTYPLGHIITASYWHNLGPESRHLTLADTSWGKDDSGKIYGQ